ncbi:UBC-like protein [Athelia psychrophila]|uniref:UBC-like protein n=1 Tax=Athelia psychrophila TaxID=1759441 RepID=A0A166JG82_9AGAM|nr:UBC-like protein [Fibularhizoctonia sp. CBS 109695]
MAALNKNNSAVKRIMQEARELANDPCTDYSGAPLEDDIFEWHCTLRGPADTEFEGGLYHFRILLPAEYPFRPPSIMILTPNGRFELNTKICISFTNYHEDLWQPAWGVRTAIIGLQGFFPLKGQAAVGVGSIEYPVSERKRLAALSREWICPHCQQTNLDALPDPAAAGDPSSSCVVAAAPASVNTATADSLSIPQLDSTEDDATSLIDTGAVDTPRSGPPTPEMEEDREAEDPPTAAGTTQSQNARSESASEISNLPHPVPHDHSRILLNPTTTRSVRTVDSAIGVLLVLAVALVCRRLV